MAADFQNDLSISTTNFQGRWPATSNWHPRLDFPTGSLLTIQVAGLCTPPYSTLFFWRSRRFHLSGLLPSHSLPSKTSSLPTILACLFLLQQHGNQRDQQSSWLGMGQEAASELSHSRLSIASACLLTLSDQYPLAITAFLVMTLAVGIVQPSIFTPSVVQYVGLIQSPALCRSLLAFSPGLNLVAKQFYLFQSPPPLFSFFMSFYQKSFYLCFALSTPFQHQADRLLDHDPSSSSPSDSRHSKNFQGLF